MSESAVQTNFVRRVEQIFHPCRVASMGPGTNASLVFVAILLTLGRLLLVLKKRRSRVGDQSCRETGLVTETELCLLTENLAGRKMAILSFDRKFQKIVLEPLWPPLGADMRKKVFLRQNPPKFGQFWRKNCPVYL